MPSEGDFIRVDYNGVQLVALLVGVSRDGYLLSFLEPMELTMHVLPKDEPVEQTPDDLAYGIEGETTEYGEERIREAMIETWQQYFEDEASK